MFNVLQAREIPSKLVMFPDENHVSLDSVPTSDCCKYANTLLVGIEA